MLSRLQLQAISATCGAGGMPETDLLQVCDTALAAMDERDALRAELARKDRQIAQTWAHANEDEHNRTECPICALEAKLDVKGIPIDRLAAMLARGSRPARCS